MRENHLLCMTRCNGFVRRSEGFSVPGMWCTSISLLLTESRMKCARMSMCFMREWDCGSWVQETVPWLSQYKEVGNCCGNPSSWKSERSQMIWRAQCEQARYSASHDDRATTTCCFELQDSGPFAHSIKKPEMDFRFSDIAQSESANALKSGYGFG